MPFSTPDFHWLSFTCATGTSHLTSPACHTPEPLTAPLTTMTSQPMTLGRLLPTSHTEPIPPPYELDTTRNVCWPFVQVLNAKPVSDCLSLMVGSLTSAVEWNVKANNRSPAHSECQPREGSNSSPCPSYQAWPANERDAWRGNTPLSYSGLCMSLV